MASTILMINGSQSKFFIKDSDGNILELKEGDKIDENAIVYGDKSNSSSASIEIALNNGAGNIVLSGAQEQVFDNSLTDGPSMEGGLAKDSIDELDNDLYAKDDEPDNKEEDLGILDEDTASGEEQAKQNEDGESVFEYRNGEQTDIVAGLRNASFSDNTSRKNTEDSDQKPPLNAANDDVAIQANNDIANASETGHEFINSEDEANDSRVASGNILTNDTTNIATTITQISFGSVIVNIPTNGTDVSIDGEYGTLTINNSGAFSFAVDDSDTTVDALNIGDNVIDGFVYTLSDSQNPDTSATLEIKIDGMDDAPVINSISVNNQPLHSVDGLLDVNNDDIADIVSPDDLVSRDRGLIFNENNGNITIDMGSGDSSLAVDYHGGAAGYKNILGFYEKDANGNIVDVKIIYVDRGDDDGKGGNFDSFLGSESLSLGTLNNLSSEVGFFIIPNGYSNTNVANAINNNFDVSIDPATFKVIFTNPNNATDTTSLNKAYYTDNDMSTDGRDHAIITKNPDGGLTIGMEDLPAGGTDQDYDDVVFTIKPCATLHSPTQTTLFSEGFEGVDKGAGDSNGRAWYVDHGTDGDNILVSNSGHEWIMNDAGLEMRADNGVHGLDTADGSDTYVELDAHTRGTNSSITTDVNLGQGNDTFTLSFNFIPRPGQADTSDMKFSLDGNEVTINVDASGNITYEAPSGVEVKITQVDGSSWFNISATFTGIQSASAELNFQAVGTADTLGAYIDNIEVVGIDYSTANTILKNIDLSDVDDVNLEGATLSLVNFKVGDVIDADNLPNGITASITGGVVTLSGSASISDYEAALESLTFGTTSEDREVRDFEVTVFDGDKHSDTMKVSLDIGGCSLNTGEYLSPPTADEVTTTSNINSDDSALNALITTFANDADKPDISDIAFFKKFDVGGGLDGTGIENNSNDPADLGGKDAQSLEGSLSYEITKLASEDSYGDLYLETNGIFTKITDANMDSMTFSNGDNVYWVATHDQVLTNGDAISLGGADDFGNRQSVEDSWAGVTLKAVGLDGNESDVTYNSSDGLGVKGVAGGTNNQIGYDARSENTERMIVDFASAVTSAKIGITHLYNNGSESEVGVVDAYLDGNKVGSFTFSNNIGNANFTPDFVLTTDNIGSGNSGTSQAGYFSIEDLAFDQLQFSANPYVNQIGVSDSSDYFLASIDVKEVADAQYQYKVIDESGLESDSVDVVINVDTTTPMHLNEVQTVNNIDTVVLEDSISLNFSDDNLTRLENIEAIQMNGNGAIVNISLEDVLDITESSNTLIITGNGTDRFDASELNESGDWTQDSAFNNLDGSGNTDSTTYSYSHSDGYSVELTIDEEIITTGM